MADQQWQDLMKDWQACSPSSEQGLNKAVDLKTLQDKTRRKARRMMFFMWADIISAIVFVGVFMYLLTTDINSYQAIIFIGVSFIILPAGIYSVLVRQGLWKANGNSSKAYLELARDRAMAGIKLAKMNLFAALTAFPFLIAMIGWRAYVQFDTVDWPINKYVIGLLLQLMLFAGMAWGARWYQRKKEVEHQRFQQMLEQWQAADDQGDD